MMAGSKPPRPARRFAVVLVLAVVINAPILFMTLNSFQTTEQMLATHSVLPGTLSLDNYRFLLQRTPYIGFFFNSGLIAGASTLATLVAAGLAGYAMSRWHGAVLALYGRGLLMVQMFPLIMALIPLFIIFRTLGLINNPLSVIIIYTAVHLPFATWMFRSFFDTIPP